VKRSSLVGTAIAVVASLVLAGSALAAFAGVTNGSFENGTYAPNGSGFQTLGTGSVALTGWSVTSGSIDWNGTYWTADAGAMSLDMDGNEPGAITQTLATTIGNTYLVSFYMSGNPDGLPVVKTLNVSATGALPATYTFDTSVGNTHANMMWVQQKYSFLATSVNTVLTFASGDTASPYGPAMDNVVVNETVPTGAGCKTGGWQTMIDTSGNHFKNQGDCVSFYASGGKNLGAIAP
jgi:choice-of-anchor C domain-containing protein